MSAPTATATATVLAAAASAKLPYTTAASSSPRHSASTIGEKRKAYIYTTNKAKASFLGSNVAVPLKPVPNSLGEQRDSVDIGDRDSFTKASGDGDRDNGSVYGKENDDDTDVDISIDIGREESGKKQKGTSALPPSPAVSSYEDLASLNPYTYTTPYTSTSTITTTTTRTSNNNNGFSPVPVYRPRTKYYPPTETEVREREAKYKADMARLAWELDTAYATILQREIDALAALRRLTEVEME